MPNTPLPATSPHLMAVQSARFRLKLAQIDKQFVALRNLAYKASPAFLSSGRILIWQDSGPFHAAGELVSQVGALAFALSTDSLSVLEPRLQGLESFVPSQACTTLVEHALAPVLDLIEHLSGNAVTCEDFVRLDAIDEAGPPALDPLAVRIGFVLLGTNDETRIRGSVRGSIPFWQSLDFSRMPPPAATRHRAVPLRLAAQLGHCRMALAELRGLRRGDALRVTPKPPRHDVGLAVRLVHSSRRFGCMARLTGDQLTLETSMDSLTDTTPLPIDPATSSRLDDPDFTAGIECELTFELGTVRMTLGEIARLRVGQALRMGLRLQEQPVGIVTGGRQIARGELAAIGDELVVVVTQTHGLPDI